MTEVVAPAARCVTCGAARTGPYCAACGQRARDGRITLAHVARHVAADLSPVDHGIVFTALSLLRRPGHMVRDYVDGRTVRYVGPMKYFVLVVGAVQLLILRSSLPAELVSGLLEGSTGQSAPSGAQATIIDFLSRYFVSAAAVGVPLFAALMRALFRRARLNYAEHLVFALYTGAQQVGVLGLVAWLVETVREPAISNMHLLLALAYQVWATRQLTGAGVLASAWRTLLAMALTAVLLATVVLILIERRA